MERIAEGKGEIKKVVLNSAVFMIKIEQICSHLAQCERGSKRGSERERVCVCVCLKERERDGEREETERERREREKKKIWFLIH